MCYHYRKRCRGTLHAYHYVKEANLKRAPLYDSKIWHSVKSKAGEITKRLVVVMSCEGGREGLTDKTEHFFRAEQPLCPIS